jgi:GxxExxY protein
MGYSCGIIRTKKKKFDMLFPLSDRAEFLGKEIVDCAYKVHKGLGPGLLEKIYEACFCHELEKKSLPFRRQVSLPIHYDGKVFDEGLKLDVLVDEMIICELKAREVLNPLWTAQILSHMKLTNCRLGYLINFNVPFIKDGIKRYIV